jgi:hypothetical protein
MNTKKIRRKRKMRRTIKKRRSGKKINKRRTRKGGSAPSNKVQTVKILIHPATLKAKKVVSKIVVSDPGIDIEEVLAEIVAGNDGGVKKPYYVKEIKVNT